MSHVATVDVEIKDLAALEAACKRLGLEFVRDQKQYHWFGESVGDYPLPEGFAEDDLGKCDHAIRVSLTDAVELATRHNNHAPYEVGVVKRRDGRPGWQLMWDFFQGGFGLQERVGEDCNKLRQAYAIETAKKTAIATGFRVHEQARADGSVNLVLSK